MPNIQHFLTHYVSKFQSKLEERMESPNKCHCMSLGIQKCKEQFIAAKKQIKHTAASIQISLIDQIANFYEKLEDTSKRQNRTS